MTVAFRPLGLPSLLATDDTYTAPGEDWDGLPTKVEPTSGEKASGFVPEQPIDAEVQNFYLNDLTRRQLAVDLIEVTNWPEPAPNAGVLGSTSGNSAGGMVQGPEVLDATFTPGAIYSFVYNDEAIAVSYDGGYTWTSDYTSAGNDFKAIASGASSVAAILDAGGTPKIAKVSSSQAWTEQTITPTLAQIAFDPVAGVYYIAGRAVVGTDPRISIFDESDLPQTETLITPALHNSVPMRAIAVGKDLVLFADVVSIYTYDRTGTPVKSHTFAGTEEIESLVADTESGYFYALVNDTVSSLLSVYESADGTTWTLKSAGSLIVDCEATAISLAARGSALVFGVEANTKPMLAISGDRGVTWRLIPDPLLRHSNQTQLITLVGTRLTCLGYKSAGDRTHVFSMRAGPLA